MQLSFLARSCPEQLEAEALELPVRERAALAHLLLEDLAETERSKARYMPKQGQYHALERSHHGYNPGMRKGVQT